MLASFTPHQLI